MAILSSEAIILSAMRYGETSKIVRLATRDYGVQSAIARGALRPKSRFGASLQVMSRGLAQLIPARQSDLHQLAAFDLLHLPMNLGATIERYTAASVMAEVMQRFAPADPHPELFEALRDGLLALETAPAASAGAVGLRGLWRLVAMLGFEPALDACVLDGTAIDPSGTVAFSAREGGALCPDCARTHAVQMLSTEDRRDLVALLDPVAAVPALDARHDAAHRRLLARFIHHQMAEGAELPALAIWEQRAWESS